MYGALFEMIEEQGGVRIGDTVYQFKHAGYDNKYDPTEAVTVTRRAVFEDGVKFVEVCCAVTAAMAPITDAEEILVLTIDGIGGHNLGPDHPLTFFLFYDPANAAVVIYEYLAETRPDLKRTAMLDVQGLHGEHGQELKGELVPELGFEVVLSEIVPLEMTDFFPLATGVLAADPDIIDIGTLPPGQWPLLVQAARDLGYEGVFIFPDQLLPSVVSEIISPDLVEGSYYGPHFEFTAEAQNFHDRVTERLGYSEPYFMIWHDLAMLMRAAFEEAQSIDPVDVAEALGRVSVDGLISADVHFGGEALSGGLPRSIVFPLGVAVIGEDFAVTEVHRALGPSFRE